MGKEMKGKETGKRQKGCLHEHLKIASRGHNIEQNCCLFIIERFKTESFTEMTTVLLLSIAPHVYAA